MVLPSGLATDQGAAPLRRALLDRTRIDNLVSLENREAMFPVHRSLKFLLISATAGGRSAMIPCRFGIQKAEALDGLPELGPDLDAVTVARPLLEQLSGEQIALPDVRSERDVDILGRIAFTAPALGDAMVGPSTSDASSTRPTTAATSLAAQTACRSSKESTCSLYRRCRGRVPTDSAGRRRDAREPRQTFGRARLAYREVASATNRLTLLRPFCPKGRSPLIRSSA